MPMRATIAILGVLPVLLLAAPASAATKEERMATCKFGAEHDKLTGAKRDAFIKKCMANANYEPAARREALKKGTAKKPAAAPAAAAPAEAPEASEPAPDNK
jgi:hypothetical protein